MAKFRCRTCGTEGTIYDPERYTTPSTCNSRLPWLNYLRMIHCSTALNPLPDQDEQTED